MDTLLDRLRHLSSGARRLATGACIVIAALAFVPEGGHSASSTSRPLAVPAGWLTTVVTVDADAAAVLHRGDQIELVDTGRSDAFDTSPPHLLGVQVLVLSVSGADGFGRQTRHLVVAADAATALRLASTQGHRVLAVIAIPP